MVFHEQAGVVVVVWRIDSDILVDSIFGSRVQLLKNVFALFHYQETTELMFDTIHKN